MLVLTRRKGEYLDITTAHGERISIVVTEIEQGRVRLGVIAARETLVLRRELVAAAEDGNAD